MELVAILVLGISTIIGFSTKENQPKPKASYKADKDPDSAFRQPCDLDSRKE